MARGDDKKSDEKEREADRYRKAAEDALQQLDWAIGYLHGIRKTDISRALAKNRSYIRTRLMEREEEPLPTQQSGET
jgi:dsDNA-binding SOS-regulon protein